MGLFDWDEVWEKKEITLSFNIRRNRVQELLVLTRKLDKIYGPSPEKDYYFTIEADIELKGNIAEVTLKIGWWYDTEVLVEPSIKKDLMDILEKLIKFIVYD